jgi:hypothetical protein
MLAGTKPFAAFSDDYPSLHGLYVIPECEFEQHNAITPHYFAVALRCLR